MSPVWNLYISGDAGFSDSGAVKGSVGGAAAAFPKRGCECSIAMIPGLSGICRDKAGSKWDLMEDFRNKTGHSGIFGIKTGQMTLRKPERVRVIEAAQVLV